MEDIIKNYNQEKSVFIIDGHSMIYRAYYAFIKRPLMNSKGMNTSAIFGFLRMLIKFIKVFKPKYLIISFDTGKPNFRHTLFTEYKATRKKMPEDLIPQIPELKKIIKLLGIPQIEVAGYESDDSIAKIAKDFAEQDYKSFIITKDKDLLQLVEDKINILQPETGNEGDSFVLIDNKKVIETYDLEPKNIIDFLSLTGDTSDNIPGVKGIGPKSATDLIKQFKTIENLYEHLDEVHSKPVKEKLITNKENAFLSKKLIRLALDIDLKLKSTDLLIKDPDKDEIIKEFEKLEIKTLLKDLNWLDNFSKEKKYELVNTIEKFTSFIKQLKEHKIFAFDTETDSHLPVSANLVGMSFSFKANEGYYIPVGHAAMLGSEQLSLKDVQKDLAGILSSEEYAIIGQNVKFDYLVMLNHGIEIKNIHFDTMVASYLINPTKTRHNLSELALHYLGYKMITFKEVVGKKKNFSEVTIEDAANYSIEDADITFQLYYLLNDKIKELNLNKIYYEIDLPLIKVLADIEQNGVKIDVNTLQHLNKIVDEKLKNLTADIYNEAGEKFNINSTKQLSVILFEKLGLNPGRKGKTGLSTDIEVLQDLQNSHSIAKLLIDYRTLYKLKTTYIETLPEMVNPKTKRIHTCFSQTTAATGRLSSSDPNLQNIPIRDEFGKKIREAFVADNNQYILSADYSQIELRILAHIAEDEVLMDAFKKDEDIHTRTIMELYNISKEEVTPEQRRMAKIINYGVIYGMSAFGLSKALTIGVDEAKVFINNYFIRYKGIKIYIDKIKKDIEEKGYVENIFGRRRYLPDMSNISKLQKGFIIRTAVNTPIQGTAADLIKLAMIAINNELIKHQLKSKMILQVHDELLFEVLPEEKDIMLKIVKDKMENIYKFKIPIRVDINLGKNWGEVH